MQNNYKLLLLFCLFFMGEWAVQAQTRTSNFTLGNRRGRLTDLKVNNIAAIRVRSGDWIDAIQLVGSGRKITPLAGGRGGKMETFTLRAGEKVTSILITKGDYINSIRFGTNRGRYSKIFGKKNGTPQSFRVPPRAPNGYFVGFGVYAGQYVTGMKVYYREGRKSGGTGVSTNNKGRSFAIIYANANYKGRSKAFKLGNFNANSLGIGPNKLSSLRLTQGYAIRVYSKPNFTGRTRLFTRSISFVGNDWNDRISSLKVIRYRAGSTGGGGNNNANMRAVTLARPANNATLDNGCRNNTNGVNWSFSWVRKPKASYYHIRVYRQGSARAFIDQKQVRTNSFTRNRRGFVINANRFGWKWKVRAMVNGRWTAWSETRSFRVEPLDKDCGGSSGTSSNIGTKRSYRVMFKNSSIFVVTYRLTYTLNGQKKTIKREKKAPNWSRSFDVPANAKNVKVNIRYIKQTAWAELYRQNITLNRNRCFNVRTKGLSARLSQGGCF